MFKIIRYLPIIVGLLVLSPNLAVSQNAGGGNWSAPRSLGDGWWQSMTLDREGRLHIAWYGGLSPEVTGSSNTLAGIPLTFDVLSYTSRSLDGTWATANDIKYTGTGGFTVRNALTTTSDGMVHALYREGSLHTFSSAYAPNASDASTWTLPAQINDYGYYLNLIADRNDVLHVAYNGRILGVDYFGGEGNLERNTCVGCGDIIYVRSIDGGRSWTPPKALIVTPNTGSDKMSFFESPSGRLYLFWDEGTDWYQGRGQALDVRITYTDDAGLTWSDPSLLTGNNPSIEGRPIQLAFTELIDGTLMAAWRYSSDDTTASIFYQTSSNSGETWTTPQAIPGLTARSINDTPLDDYELLTDQNGSVHLFAIGYLDGSGNSNPALYQITYRQGIWLPPQRIFYSPEMRPEWPKVVLGLTNDIHLTWFTRGFRENIEGQQEQDPTASLRVFYSHLEGNIPLLATMEFNPTQTPLPSPTPFQVLGPTLTPFPTTQVTDRSVYLGTTDQYATVTVLGGLGAATLFCALILVVMRLRR